MSQPTVGIAHFGLESSSFRRNQPKHSQQNNSDFFPTLVISYTYTIGLIADRVLSIDHTCMYIFYQKASSRLEKSRFSSFVRDSEESCAPHGPLGGVSDAAGPQRRANRVDVRRHAAGDHGPEDGQSVFPPSLRKLCRATHGIERETGTVFNVKTTNTRAQSRLMNPVRVGV